MSNARRWRPATRRHPGIRRPGRTCAERATAPARLTVDRARAAAGRASSAQPSAEAPSHTGHRPCRGRLQAPHPSSTSTPGRVWRRLTAATGRVAGPFCSGRASPRGCVSLTSRRRRPRGGVGPLGLASDLPMLRAVGHPVAVNPDRALSLVATRWLGGRALRDPHTAPRARSRRRRRGGPGRRAQPSGRTVVNASRAARPHQAAPRPARPGCGARCPARPGCGARCPARPGCGEFLTVVMNNSPRPARARHNSPRVPALHGSRPPAGLAHRRCPPRRHPAP